MRAHAVGQTGKPGAVPLFGAAEAVVLDAYVKVVASGIDMHCDLRGARVLDSIGDRLARDVVRGRLQIPVNVCFGDAHVDRNRHRVDEHRQRGHEPVVQTARTDAVRKLPQLADSRPELCDRLVEQTVHVDAPVRKTPLREPQRHPERDESQLGAVVQITFESLPLVVARAKHS